MILNIKTTDFYYWEPLKTGLKRENGQSAPNAMKADEVRLYALRGGLKKQSVCYTHFHSNKVFRGDHKFIKEDLSDELISF